MRERLALLVSLALALLVLALNLVGRPSEIRAVATAPTPPREARETSKSIEGPAAQGGKPERHDMAGLASRCAACHPFIAEEWRASMHRRSTAELNGLYRLMRKKARVALGPEGERKCNRCHYAAYAPTSQPSSGARGDRPASVGDVVGSDGVTCLVCHVLRPGHPTERLDDGRAARLAGWDVGRLGSEPLCLSCHGELLAPSGQPICTTGVEAEEALAGTCVDCHMKDAPGPATPPTEPRPEATAHPSEAQRAAQTHASHRFPGSRSKELLERAATLTLSIEAEPDPRPADTPGRERARTLVVTLAAGELGHAFPTGSPLRTVVVHVTARDAAGDRVWRNFESDPRREAPDAVLQHRFTDENGAPIPPFLAKKPGEDRRLQPDATRVLRYPLPPDAVTVEAWLRYHLAPPKMLVAAGLPPAERAPKDVARATLTLP